MDFELFGAAMLLLRSIGTGDGEAVLIIETANFLKSAAPGALTFSKIWMTEATRRWLSCMSFPSCFRSRPWYRILRPQRVSISFLFKQKENDMLRSSRSCTIWMMCLLESANDMTEGEDLEPKEEPTAGR